MLLVFDVKSKGSKCICCKYWSIWQIFCDSQQCGSRLTRNYNYNPFHSWYKLCIRLRTGYAERKLMNQRIQLFANISIIQHTKCQTISVMLSNSCCHLQNMKEKYWMYLYLWIQDTWIFVDGYALHVLWWTGKKLLSGEIWSLQFPGKILFYVSDFLFVRYILSWVMKQPNRISFIKPQTEVYK